jgi:acyl carrier protein
VSDAGGHDVRYDDLRFLDDFVDVALQIRPDLGVDELGPETAVSALDMDSLALVEMLSVLEDRYHVVIPDSDLMTIVTVGDLACVLEKVVKGRYER